jgi:hypothetical protein
VATAGSFFGLSTDLGPIAQWGIDSIRSTIPVVPSLETSLPGVFAIGDGHLSRQAEADPARLQRGAMAAHAIHPIVRPDTALHFEYSTSKGRPRPGARPPEIQPTARRPEERTAGPHHRRRACLNACIQTGEALENQYASAISVNRCKR